MQTPNCMGKCVWSLYVCVRWSFCDAGMPIWLPNQYQTSLQKWLEHTMIHRQVLATKTLPPVFQETLQNVVSAVNFVKSSALNSHLFQKLCQDMEASNNVLLFHTEVGWLSHGKVLKCVFDMWAEMKFFFIHNEKLQFQEIFTNQLHILAYPVNIFLALNDLNLSLQG